MDPEFPKYHWWNLASTLSIVLIKARVVLDVRSIEVLCHPGLPRVVEAFYVDDSITQIYVKNPGAVRILTVSLPDCIQIV